MREESLPTTDPSYPSAGRLHLEFGDNVDGLLFIGDPHLEGRSPGFRKDDYPETILQKLKWCLEYAAQHRLQPVLLGDIFDKPRDNPNWMISRLLDLLGEGPVPAIYGNHDCANPTLDENDSLMLLYKAGAIYLMDEDHLWVTKAEGKTVILGGSPYRYPIPETWSMTDRLLPGTMDPRFTDAELRSPDLAVWITHHDLTFPTEDDAVVTHLNEIPGLHFVVNGHIHRRSPTVVERGATKWINPGNIARRSRSDAIRGHVPAVLRMDITSDGEWLHYVDVPHAIAQEVFYDLDAMLDAEEKDTQSSFVTGLALLQSRKTASGAGLLEFIRENVQKFDPEVASEILRLAKDVLDSNPTEDGKRT